MCTWHAYKKVSRVVLRNYKVMGSKKICAIFDIAHIFLDPISTYLVCPCEINNVLFWAAYWPAKFLARLI